MTNTTQPFYLPAGPNTPAVTFDYAEGTMTIRGNSIAENGQAFYRELIERVSLFKLSDKSEVVVNIDLDQFNSQATKALFLLFRELRKLKDKRKKLVLRWYWDGEDEDTQEFVRMVNSQLDLHFELINKA